MDIKTEVKLFANDLAVGESKQKLLCPSCGGGRSREKTFSVSRTEYGVLYNCYRAKCGESGFVGSIPAPVLPRIMKLPNEKLKPREYWHSVRMPAEDDLWYFSDRFQLKPVVTTRYVRTSDYDEYIFPIYGINGFERGYVVRQPLWKGLECPRKGREGRPKAQTFPHVREPMQSFYVPSEPLSEALVVVEDQVSAIKVCQAGHRAVALLGCNVDADKVREWSQLKPKEVLIALDKDATAAAFKIAGKWGLCFHGTRVVLLERDLKDEDIDDITEVLGL